MCRNDSKPGLLLCTSGIIVLALIPARLMAATNDPLPTYYFLGKDLIDLRLDGGRVAVRFRTELVAAEAVSAAIEAGVPAVRSQPLALDQWHILRLETPVFDAQGADLHLEALLASSEVVFASPVFHGLAGSFPGGGFVIITGDVVMQFKPEHAPNAVAILTMVVPELRIVSDSVGTIKDAFRLRSSSANGFDVLASANCLAQDTRVAWAEPNALISGCGGSCIVGDFDRDLDVDLADYLWILQCFSGPGRPIEGCRSADFDADGDVDLADLLTFQGAFTGPR